MDDLLKDFLAETCEALDVLDSEIVELEQRPGDPALLGSIFRVMHTIKGTCGFLGLPRLEAVAHAAEDVLGRVRDGELAVAHDVISQVLIALDRIKELVASLGANGCEPAGEDREIIDTLRRIASGETAAPASAAPAPEKQGTLFDRAGAASGIDTACELACAGFAAKSADGAELEPELLKLQFALAKGFEVALQSTPGIDIADVLTCLTDNGWTEEDIALLETEIGQGFRSLGVEEEDVAALLALLHRGAQDAPQAAPPPQTKEPVAAAPASASPSAEKQDAAAQGQTQTLRVNINVLEDLMTLVSELVLTRNQLLQIMRSHDDSPFAAPLQRLNQVTTELQESVMMTRMQPIGNAWGKLPRLVRDLSQEVGKKIELSMTGADTELDRQVLESIRDPLTHMVRNSADHGIEIAADRLAAGKPEHGTIELSARHEGGHIVVVVADDGRGLPTARIREKVLANGLATESQLEGMSEQQIQQFIFRPGFSTAAAVTSVSGRGVGMDVVRNNIEKIGGIIEFQSTEGVGSRFTIKIPLTLAIVSALIVECEGERFALPQNSVVELVRINPATSKGLENINGHPVYRLRDRLLPLVSLCEILGLPQTGPAAEAGEAESMYVVVSQVGAFTFGIIVDKVFDTEEIVVKPVSRCMRHISCFSGTTILGDGRVIMILDPNGLASAVSASPHAEAATLAGTAGRGSRRDEAVSMLVFEARDGGPKAVPLSLVARLEEADLATAEKAGSLTVLQYRGGLMPLIDLEGNPAERKGRHPILVFVDGQRMLGLVVDRVVDIVEAPLDLQLSGGGRPGTLGSAIIAGAATDIVDTVHYLRQSNTNWFEVKTESPFGAESERNVLLVEDSAFFRNLLIPMLTVAGYSVTVAEHAEAAISLCKEGGNFDVIVSDIEMPGLSGFDLVRQLRADERMSATPIVALSSHANPKDIARGKDAGFTDYVTKLDPTALLNALSRTHAEESRKEDAA